MESVDKWPAVRRRGRYDWDTILNGGIWKLAPGEYGRLNSFRVCARTAGDRRGLKVETCTDADGYLYVRAIKPKEQANGQEER